HKLNPKSLMSPRIMDFGSMQCKKSSTIIRTKWVFRNKMDENGLITRNKARLVAKGYNQEKEIDFDETFASVVD
ncbi:reverse transcriptase domain-containing protein, partial [Klebsiella pneumoniae]|uniref:reverse transcriptase domain-containing protein n=1 Tax=Klebsiella pneumoniae TaxID=573 RepID=UPI003013E2EE